MRSCSIPLLCAAAGAGLLLAGCSENSILGGRSDADWATDTGYPGEADADYDGDEGTGANDDTQPPEQEDDFIALRPAQTDIYVFIANPTRGTVTRVNVFTQDVLTTDVGNDPQVVLTSPDYTTAVVFNRGDDSVTILDADTLASFEVEVRDNFNNMVMSPNGNWVGLWHDRAAESPDDPPPTGVQSFNEASFVHVPTGDHFPMAVGFNPRDIRFTPDSTLAVVVSDEFLAMVDLTVSVPSPTLVQVAEDLLDPPIAEEVAITPSGAYAFVRQFGAEDLVVVDLSTHDVSRLPVGINPTDLDLTPDGTKAVVVSRGSGEVYVFDAANPFDTPDILALPEEATLGSVVMAPSGDQAILYTTAVLEATYATWDLGTDEITLRSLVKPVAGIAVTPTGESLLVFHTKDDAVDADPNSPFDNKWALSLIDLDDFRSNPLLLPSEPIGYANALSGLRGYLIMENQQWLSVLRYDTLLYDEYRLRSYPVHLGVLPDLDIADGDEPPAWVSQEHSLGRISFFDPDDESMETITGFELNSGIED
ncbi:MAG: hypothetical protein JRJ84_04930 [Deltaproteobacteria bacterium]|nr:hypothetical protein [Deltaproteobacteria bacterium]